MNRELKFRVWNGAEMIYDVTVGKFGTFYVNPYNNGLTPNDSASLTLFTTKYNDGTSVMQFTGMKDKEGKDVYENDIVILPADQVCRIEYRSARFIAIAINPPSNYPKQYEWWSVKKVLGNIYKNPELIQAREPD